MCSHRHVILHLFSKFRRDRKIGCGVMTSYRFFKMVAYSWKCTSKFRFSDDICLRRWKSICLPNFDEISQFTDWDKTTSGFRKRTATILEFYFRFRFWRTYSHRHVILHLPAKFSSKWTIGGGVKTSYRFFKMAAIESEMYFRVPVWWRVLFKNVKIYLPAKFRWDISIHGWDKTTSGFGKQTAAKSKSEREFQFSFRFRFWRMYSHRHVILHLPANFRSNRTIGGGVMKSYRFFKIAAIESEMYFRVQV